MNYEFVKINFIIVICLCFVNSYKVSGKNNNNLSDTLTIIKLHKEARQLIYKANYNFAFKKSKKALILSKFSDNKKFYVQSLNLNAEICLIQGKLDSCKIFNYESLEQNSNLLLLFHKEYINALKTKGELMLYWGIPAIALEQFEDALRFRRIYAINDTLLTIELLLKTGNAYEKMGDFISAEDFYKKAKFLADKAFGENNRITADCYTMLGWNSMLRYDTELLETSVKLHKKAQRIYLNTIGKHHPDYARFLRLYGTSLEGSNLTRRTAVQVYLEAEKIYIDRNEQNTIEAGKLYRNLLRVNRSLEHFDKAVLYGKKSIRIFSSNLKEKNPDIARTWFWLADIYKTKMVFDSALMFCQKSIVAYLPGYDEKNYRHNPNIDDIIFIDHHLIESCILKGKIFYCKYLNEGKRNIKDLEKSYDTFLFCDKLTDKFLTRFGSDKNIILQGKLNSIYINDLNVVVTAKLFQLTGEKEYLEQMFFFTEKNKAGLLNIKMGNDIIDKVQPVPDSILIKMDEIKKYFYNIEDRIKMRYNFNGGIKDDNSEKNNQAYLKTLEKLNTLKNFISQNYPLYSLLSNKLKISTIEDIQKHLKEDEIIIEYVFPFYNLAISEAMDVRMSYIFLISKQDCKLVPFGTPEYSINNEIILLLNIFRDAQIQNSLSQAFIEEFVKSTTLLYNTLLKPVEKEIVGKNLIIIPDGLLNFLPFELLLTTDVSHNNCNYLTLPYLIKQNPVSYAHTATLYNKTQDTETNTTVDNLLAFAPSFGNNPVFDDPLVMKSIERGDCFSDLPGSIAEVLKIGDILKGKVFTGNKATETEFKRDAANYNILHIATHGIVDNENPMNSKLLFSQNDSINDGFLNAYEIYGMKLNAEMAVLSACNTGIGKLERGEGVMNIARSFYVAGVPSVVMSLWKVKDNSTATIMESFYKYLFEGYSKSKALQLAKIDYIQNAEPLYNTPFHWAGFVHFGKQSPIVFSKPGFKFYWLLFLLIPVGLFFRFRK